VAGGCWLVARESDRQRRYGKIVLAISILVACVHFVRASPSSSLDDSNAPGYERSLHHQMGQMMGHFGLIMEDWQDALAEPIVQSTIIAVVGGLISLYFFRYAFVLDEAERERPPATN